MLKNTPLKLQEVFSMSAQLKPFTHQEAFGDMASGNEILEDAIDKREITHKLTTEILDKLTELNNVLQRPCPISGTTNVMLVRDLFDVAGGYGDDFSGYKKEIDKRFDSKFWSSVIHKSSITAVMHSEMKEKFSKNIEEKPPTFDREHIYGTLTHYMDNRFTIFVEGALNLFKTLNKNFKTNDGIKFKEKLIFGDAFGGYGWCRFGRSQQRIEDLERIFYVLDGIDPTRRSYDQWATRRMEKLNAPEEAQFEYFKVKLFKNGNVHLWLTRPDLVEKLNGMIADHFGESLGHRSGVRN